MKLSIIIPVYNEATQIEELLFYLKKVIASPDSSEMLIIDGGSTDNTLEKIKKIEGVHLIQSDKGRGNQMNKGAKYSKGEVLYFLHADSLPPKDFDTLIFNKIEQGHRAGCFKMKFDSSHIWLRLASWFTKFNVKFFRGGDQSLFIDKAFFKEIGGFPEEHPIFEDFTLIRELYKRKTFTVIQKDIISSSRRYSENGIAKLQFHYWYLYLKKWCGTPIEDLVEYYKKNVK